jgi:hypothetical protein
VPGILADLADDLADSQFAKASFIGELYAPAGYLVLLISASGPKTLRLPLRATVWLKASRALMTLGPALIGVNRRLLPRAFHRQLPLMPHGYIGRDAR